MARRAAFDSGRFERTLRRLMADFLREHRAIGEDLIETIIRYIASGVSVHRAIDEALNSTAYDRRVTEAIAQAAYLAACDGFGALPTMIANAGGVRGKLLAESWTGDGMRLSERLHRPALRNTIVRAVSEGMSRADDARETALRLYDGYGKGGAINRQAVAKDIDALRRQALLAVGDDGLKALRDRARAVKGRVDDLTTSGLRVAYKNLIRACMAPELKAAAIERAARVAVEEKTRYVAERIARTEAARAWFDGFLAETAADPDIWGYKWVLSSGHRLLGYVDECDVAARADVGYGPGVYPKDRCPGIPLHPHCMCSLVPVAADDSEAQSRPMNPGGARRYIDGLTERGRRQLFGVDGARAYRDGADWTAFLRGWPGFRTPAGRLTAADFQTLMQEKAANAPNVGAVERDYDCPLAAAIGKEDYDKLIDTAEANCKDSEVLALFSGTHRFVKVGDLAYKQTAQTTGDTVYLDWKIVKQGNEWHTPFETAFHEIGHAIDNMHKGKCQGSPHSTSAGRDALFEQTVTEEIKALLKPYIREVGKRVKQGAQWFRDNDLPYPPSYYRRADKDAAKKWCACFLLREKLKAKGYGSHDIGPISDMISGVCKSEGCYLSTWHPPRYWYGFVNRDARHCNTALAREFFAEMMAAHLANPRALELTRSVGFLPRSYALFKDAVRQALKAEESKE